MRCFGLLFFLLGLALAALPAAAAVAGTPAGTLCADAIRAAEAGGRLPRGLLNAVALSESGRREPGGAGRFVPWPWTVNNAGDGRYFGTKAEAMAWVEELRRDGRKNIDVGCMQVNLMHHPDAFADLDQALDPAANVRYGARFLSALRDETNSWDRAVERYHNAEPDRGGAYRERVYAHWGGGGGGGGGGGARAAAAAGPAVLAPGPLAAQGSKPRHGFLRLGREPRFLPLVYGGRRPTPEPGAARRAMPRRAGLPLRRDVAPSRDLPAPEAAPGAAGSAASQASAPARRRLSTALLTPAPGRIAVLTGGPIAPFLRPVAPSTPGGRPRPAAGGGPGPPAPD